MMRKVLLVFLNIFIIFLFQKTFGQKNIDFDNIDYEAEIIKTIEIDSPIYIDLKECVLLSLLHSSHLKSREKLYESKVYEYKNSLASFLPDVGLLGYVRDIQGQLLVGGALIEDLNEIALYGGFYIKHDLTNAGRNIFEMLSKKRLKLAQNYDYKGTKQEVLYETAKTYYELILAKLTVQNLLIALRDRQHQYEISKARYEVGESDKLDVLNSEIEVEKTRIEMLEAINQFKTKQVRLARVIGVDSSSPLFPIEREIKEYNLIENLTSKEIIDNAMMTLPEIKKMEEEIKSLKRHKGKLIADVFPNLNLDFEASYQGTVRLGLLPNVTFMINADIPLGDKLYIGTITKIKALDKQIESKEYELQYFKSEVKENILVSFFNLEKSKNEITENSKKLEITKKSSEIAAGKYFEGEEELINVIHAQTNKIQTMISLTKSKVNYNISQLSIIYNGGLVNVDNILKGYNP